MGFTSVSASAKTAYLTLWEPVYDTFVLRFQPKNSSFQLPY